jgi:hypothetical protein
VTTKEFVAIEKRLLPDFPGFAVKGALMFIQPLGNTLRGFHWEASAFSRKDFYVSVFFLPLYVPTKHFHFTFGRRVGQNKRWTAESAALEGALSSEMQKDVPFLSSLKTAKDVAKALEPLTKPNEAGYVNPHCYEALAYARVRAGETTAAEDVIDTLLTKADLTVDWESEIASRAQLIRGKLLEKPEKARELLAAWESETIRNLRLETLSSNCGASDG